MKSETISAQLTQEQIARIFALYADKCSVILNEYNRKFSGWGWLTGQEFKFDYCKLYEFEQADYFDKAQLVLTPLSAISDEDAVEVRKILGKESVDKDYIKWILYENFKDFPIGSSFLSIHFANQYLIQKCYAVPLFIEPNHPLNGKDAISLGLAIDKTTLR